MRLLRITLTVCFLAFPVICNAQSAVFPYAFTNTAYGRGITWGLCHHTTAGTRETKHSILARFDCDLSLDVEDVWMKEPEHWWPPEYYFHSRVNSARRKQLEQMAREDLAK